MSAEINNSTLECAPGTAFPEDQCQRGMRMAIWSACFGALAQVAVSDSSLIILYTDMIGGSRFVSLCTTSLQQISLFVLFISVAFLVTRIGKKKLIFPATSIGVCGLGLAVLAPVFGDWAVFVLLTGLTIFSVAMAFYVAGWFPLLRDIVPSDRRGNFFGKMRMSWQGTVAIFLIISALILRWNTSLLVLQLLIAFVGVALIGRVVCIAKMPETSPSKEHIPLRESLSKVWRNHECF
jgi:MFS family permease